MVEKTLYGFVMIVILRSLSVNSYNRNLAVTGENSRL